MASVAMSGDSAAASALNLVAAGTGVCSVVSGAFVGAFAACAVAAFLWPALAAASAPSCRMATFIGDSAGLDEDVGVFSDAVDSLSFGSLIDIWRVSEEAREVGPDEAVLVEGASGAKVFVVEVAAGAPSSENPAIWSLSSPYSFHSSTCSRSYARISHG